MRKVTFGCANSLDNFIARDDGGLDWLMWSDEAMEIMQEYWPRIDTMVMGRKTWDAGRREAEASGQTSNPYAGIKTYVFSHSLPAGDLDGVEIVGGDVVEFVRGLRKQDGKDICLMGGGELARPLLEAGLIDEIGVNIHPVLLGSGVPLFHRMQRQIDLDLIESRVMKNGCVYLLYSVKRS
ncbi:MAG: dihydrofolate reductase family protein [Pyrinomonadaceae bacterium]